MSKIALSLNEENRIMSACVVLLNYDYGNMPIVDSLPDGDIYDYLYVDGEFIYEPIPVVDIEEIEIEYTAQDDTDAMLIDHEYRLTMLELGLAT